MTLARKHAILTSLTKVLYGQAVIIVTADRDNLATAIMDVAVALGHSVTYSNGLIKLSDVRNGIEFKDPGFNVSYKYGVTVIHE